MTKFAYLLAVVAAAVAVPASAQNVVTDGSFENATYNGTDFDTFTSGYAAVDPSLQNGTSLYPEGAYTVGTSALLYHNLWAGFPAYDGTRFLIANGAPGNNVPVWSQTLNGLTAGQTYGFSAYITNVCCNSSFAGGNGTPVIVATSAGNVTLASGAAPNTAQWVRLTGTFVATGTSTALSIFNDNSVASGNDFGLDAIDVHAVPEPATWGMMIVGFAAAGAALRRRRVASPAFA